MRSGIKSGPEPRKPLKIKSVPPPKTPPAPPGEEIDAILQRSQDALGEYYTQTPFDSSKFVITKGGYPPAPPRPISRIKPEGSTGSHITDQKRGTSHMLGGGLPNYNTCFLLLAILLLLAVLILYSI